MENWWLWAGAAVVFGLMMTVPVRVGFRLQADSAEVRVHALYHLVGPVQGSVRIPSLRAFKRPQRALKPGASTKGREGGRDPTVQGSWSRRRWALAVLMLRLALAIFRQIDRFDWTTRVGTGDAAYTSWCTGLLWALKSGAVSFLTRHVTWLSPPRLSVAPDFDKASFHLDLTCIFRFRIGEVIIAAISYLFGRLRKGGM